MALFPDTEELVASIEPFLRANKTKGAYRDLAHYLDIQSRLMKEDYLSPIRTGLKNFKLALQNNTNVKEDDLRFYYNVKIAKISFESDQGITHFVHFDNSPFKELDWEYSKRLMFGSLLVFSNDNFESTIFATVAYRDVEKLQRGILQVMFQNNLEKVFTSSENDTFIMAETTAYFESYRYVLEGLQEMEAIPLERYIISCMREIYPPRYLQENMRYNIASIMKNVYDSYPVPVLKDTEWPSADSTSLNDSQLEALKLALSNEIAIIQGPPGTGKTYVGLKIMRIILENKVMKKAFGSRGPILVVCYTNHALDQFLEGILDFCQTGIVRVGGGSSSPQLENFNLKQLRQNRSLSRKIPARINEAIKSFRRQLKAVSTAINRHWQETLRLETTILNVKDLEEEMSEKHKESLMDPRRETDIGGHIMSKWLKASNANMDNFLNKAAIKHLGKVIAKGDNIQNDSSLNNKKSAARTDFQTRVKIYNYWIKKYETDIEEKVDKLLSDVTPMNERKLQELMALKDEISNDILRDDILQPYMSDKVYESIRGCVKLESKEETKESSYVRNWLLNRVTRTDQLLDAIEQLTVKMSGGKQQRGRGRIFADTETAIHENRWVIDDSDDADANTDESSDENEEDEGRAMDDLDDGGTLKMSDIKELENSYKQFQDREIVMLQRAKMLGIDLTVEDDEQWQTANTMSYSKVFGLYHNAEAFTEQEASSVTDLWNLQLRDRYRLYKYWVLERKQKLTRRLTDLTEEYKIISKLKKKALSFKDIEILKRARVIGMTTTGAAKQREVLRDVGCHIIVVEEAAEVLEAHIVTTLNRNCQHLILIGDHQQLRPSPTVHKLAVDYDLEISLFERLIKNNIPHVTLTEQHRMRPEISTYLQHIYPNLQDHFSVFKYDNVRGVNSNVFFLQHEYKESEVDDTTSKANIHEARFLTGLCKYFIQHEYLGSQITVLAAYSGQVTSIRNEMEKEEGIYDNVRVTSIDNYQGEENDIILISLVRSNELNEVGFLKTDNRVCVALSRAKMGLFVIGNFQQLALKSTLWRNIVHTAKEDHVFGVGMKMVCRNHNHITYIVNPEDFAKEVPEGGCLRPCEATLPCGHTCTRLCHSSDPNHETSKCTQPCLKVCPQGHPCQKDCYRECGYCEVRVVKEIPLCGHKDQVPCYLDVDDVLCSRSCGTTMACGHICRGQCGVCMSKGHQPCLEKVDKVWHCTHRNNVECCTDTSTDPCPTKCSMRLDCGHKCKGTCGGCLSGRVHRACAEKCKQPLPCGHPCEGLCGVICAPCRSRCLTSCRHASCAKTNCGDPCDPCMENCAMVCQHRKCAALCMDECAEPPCSKMCGKPAPCKHKCMSLCGEICVCYQCEKENFHLIDTSSKNKPKWMVAHEKQERAKKFEVDKETVLMKIPKCKHIFTLAQLDRYIESFEPTDTSFLRCPVCPTPVQGISRYENINRQRAERRENMKEEIIQNSRVSDKKISRLIKSKLVVERFCTVDEGEFLSRNSEIDSNHALALSMQMRFAFALSKVYSIHRSFNQDIDFKIRKWKLIVSSIQLSMPPQLCTEMTMELHRLLLCEQFTFLAKMFKNMEIPLKDEVKTNLRAALKDLGKQQKLIPEDKSNLQGILDSLYEEFYRMAPSDEWSVDAKSLQSQVASVTDVLDQPQTEDLITILQQIAPQELKVHSTRVLERDSDTDEDDEDDDDDESN
ncbi:unnamed protein product [Candidula unifasciata]|uniref:NF-X1-type domain-containing protein n=1 Tax=Candidula unifasciata TaxID=100452 RepID=A0A8S3Z5H4_9EUPU|nr:unnamed protein product [Candidula unifasciata]